tara:strand:- start:1010 stop:1297 length:288 start_codon:yes stop_codon:yes gene_type:complete
MKLITRQTMADSAADRWALQYRGDAWGNKLDTFEQLLALGENPQPDRVDMIIGNHSWTRTECHECGAENIDVVEVGQESGTADICKYCLKTALAM